MTASLEHGRDFGLPAKFRLVAKLGQGGMAQVYLALASGPGGFHKLVVLKVLRPEFGDDARFVEMFFEEAKLAAKLNHAQIVQTYEVGGEGTRPYISMEYLDGQPLSSLIQKLTYEHFPLRLYLLVMIDMLSALHYAHEFEDLDGTPLNLVHRDVSPQNLIVTYDGQVKLVDFGIAKATGSATHTQTGVIKGKLRYIAPEQVLTNKADRRADVFAAGVMLWESLAKQRLYTGETEASMLHKRATGAEPSVLSLNPDAPSEIVAVCARAMALDPNERYSSASEFQHALEEAVHQSSLQASRRELAQLVSTTFASERSALREVIEQSGKKAKEDLRKSVAGNDDPTQEIASGARSSAALPLTMPSNQAVITSHGESTQTAVANTFAPRASFPRTNRGASLALAGIAVVGLGGYFVKERKLTPSDPSHLASSTSSAPPSSNAPTAVSAHENPEIEFRLALTPPDTLLTLDGITIPANRYQSTMPRDGAVHRLRASHPGYETEERLLRFDSDIALSISLQPTEAQKPGARPATTSTAKKPDKLGKATGTSSPPPSNKRAFDEKDPYE